MLIADTSMLVSSEQQVLFGRRILITAPRNYALRFAQAVLRHGGLPILMPTIETDLLSDYTELDAALHQRAHLDWIAFTSRNGIETVLHRCDALQIPVKELNHCHLAAIGRDAERLREVGLRVSLLPSEPSPRGIVAELAQRPESRGQRILVPAPAVEGLEEPDVIPNFVAGLEEIAMIPLRVPAYRTRVLEARRYQLELDLIRRGAVDAIAFSSAGEVAGFLAMIDPPAAGPAICCFGPYTAANARRMGLEPSVVASDFSSFDGFVEAIAAGLG
ncbi:uroporphyrinogen-III synthase [Candidatus Oscillochloris fontis]|uniref:uroporphyrinogen-III synthase n=1 Tax=Candidatus Oscillochloris fontis TaxID=2496868 RepID=UPI00101DA6C1|nr:uroporphyrinogen-III synthase [Candidatus Oscillochloris fontis]